MPDLTVHFEPAEGVDIADATRALTHSLSALDQVHAVEVHSPQKRTLAVDPVELLAAVSIGLAAIKSVSEGIGILTTFVKNVEDLVKAGRSLRNAFFEVGARKVPVAEVTPDDIAIVAEQFAPDEE